VNRLGKFLKSSPSFEELQERYSGYLAKSTKYIPDEMYMDWLESQVLPRQKLVNRWCLLSYWYWRIIWFGMVEASWVLYWGLWRLRGVILFGLGFWFKYTSSLGFCFFIIVPIQLFQHRIVNLFQVSGVLIKKL